MALLFLASVPFWFFPPLWPMIPVAILGWVNQRVLRYDALAEHADAGEMAKVFAGRRGSMYLLGLILALMAFVPLVGFFAPGAVRLELHPLPAGRAAGASRSADRGPGGAHVSRGFGAFVIGDEILVGKRQDKHFPWLIEALAKRGLRLAWCEHLGDEPERITAALRRTLATEDVVFSFGGIGATPDDHTRQCAAAALGVELRLHPEAEREIRGRFQAAKPRRSG